jgi:hypothetical protein
MIDWCLMPTLAELKLYHSVNKFYKFPRWDEETHIVVVFLCSVMSSGKMRGDCSFCWYRWNWWSSLFKPSFHIFTFTFKICNLLYFQATQLLSDIGGSVGLCLGVSLLCIVELIEAMLEICGAVYRRVRRRYSG